MRNQLEFFEIDRCSIASAQEADILFRKFLLEESMMKNLRYLSIIRCNLSPNFLSRDLKSFLEKNDQLKRLTLCMNSQSSLPDGVMESKPHELRSSIN